MKSLFTILTITGLMSFAHAQEAASPEGAKKGSYVICRNGKVVRTMRVDLKGGSCRAFYTKEGKEELVGKSGTPDLCNDVVGKIRANLEKSVWKCEDVTPDRVSFTVE